MDRNWFTNGMCVLALSAGIGCSSTQQSPTQPAEIAPFDVPTSAPRPEADEPIERFIARWNAWVDSVPEHQRIGDDLKKVLAELNHERFEAVSGFLEYSAFDTLTTALPWNEYWNEAPFVFGEFESELDQILEIVQRQHVAMKIDVQGESGDALLDPEAMVFVYAQDYIGDLRSAAAYMAASANYLAYTGEPEEAHRRLLAIADLANHASEMPTLISWLVETANQDLFQSSVVEILEYDSDTFSDVQLASFQIAMVDMAESGLAKVLLFEQYTTHQKWEQLFGDPDSPVLDEEELEYVYSIFEPPMSQFFSTTGIFPQSPSKENQVPYAPLTDQIRVYQILLEAFLRDLQSDPATLRSFQFTHAVQSQLADDNAGRYLPVLSNVVLWRMLLGWNHQFEYALRNNIVILAMHRHRLRTGNWPESLSQIDSELLPFSTTDLYSGKPLRYSLISESPRLWALGADRNDDGSRGLTYDGDDWPISEKTWFSLGEWEAMSEQRQAKYDGDWILFHIAP